MLFQQAVSIVCVKRIGCMRNWLWERERDAQIEMEKGWMLSVLHEEWLWTITSDWDRNWKKKHCNTWRNDAVCLIANLVTMCCDCERREFCGFVTIQLK